MSGKVLLPKTRRPPELRKDRPDQIVFGLAFIGRTGDGEDVENVPGGGFEGVELTIIDNLSVGCSDDRFANKIVGEKTSMERIIDTHAAAILITLILPHYPTRRRRRGPVRRRRRSGVNALSGLALRPHVAL